MMVQACRVRRAPYFVVVEPFRVTWSERKSEGSSRIRHRNGLTVKAKEKAVQELSKVQAIKVLLF